MTSQFFTAVLSPVAARRRRALVFCFAAAGLEGRAQDVMLTPPPEPTVAPVLRPTTPPAVVRFSPSPNTPYTVGPFVFTPSASVSHSWVEGLPVGGGRATTTRTRSVNASITTDIGNNWSVRYSPQWNSYSSGQLEDSVDHYVSLSGARSFDRWGVQFSESYSKSAATLIETAQQTEEETWSTSVGLGRSLTPNVQFQLGAGLNERYTDVSPDLRNWSLAPSLTRRFSDRVSVGVSAPLSYADVSEGQNYYSGTTTVNASWAWTDKIGLAAHAGVNFTRADADDAKTLSNPVMGISADYQVFEPTSISLNLSRRVSASYLRDRITEGLDTGISISQRLLGRLFLGLGYNRLENEYTALMGDVTFRRKDTVQAYRINLSTKITTRFSISGGFTRSKNDSNESLFGYSGKQYNLRLSYSY